MTTQQSPDYFRKTLSSHLKTIKELQIIITSYEREITLVQLTLKQTQLKLESILKQNSQLKQQRNIVLLELEGLRNVFKEHGDQKFGPGKYYNGVYSPKLQGRGALKQSKLEHQIQNISKEEYVIEPIRIKKQFFRQKQIESSIRQSNQPNLNEKNAGTTLAEDFLIIGPDVNDIGIFHEKNPDSSKLKLKPSLLFEWDKNIKNSISENRNKQILLRAFPDEIVAKRIKGKKYDGDVREVVEWIPNYSLSEGYFVFNLLGNLDYKDNTKKLLSESNINKQMYILCLKLPDIVSFKGRRAGQGDLWIVEKIFAISSYYPFFDSHIKCIVELCRALVLQRMKQLKEGKERFQYLGLEFSIRAFSEQSTLTEILKSYMNRKPSPSDVFSLGGSAIGTLMGSQSARLAQASFASGMMFSNIAYDQFLLILTAMLCEKTVILVSKSSTVSTFCALSLIGIITPFKYSHTIILNCDQNKVDNIIFQSPFPIIASITTNQISKLVSQAVQTNIRNEGAQFVLFDLDSNSILIDRHLKNTLYELIPAPPQDLRQQYLQYNSCKAKSLFLPKQMKIVKGGMGKKNKTKLEQKQELKRLLEEQFMEQIDQNQTKSTNWTPNYNLTEKFNNFISQFQYQGKLTKLKKGEDAKDNINGIKQVLLKTHSSYKPFLSVFLQNQIFAEYLDSKLYP